MPPVPSNFTIQSLYQGIVNKFGGRQNFGPANSDSALYVPEAVAAIGELTETYEFEELKVSSPIVPLQAGVGIYSVSQFVANISPGYDITDNYDWGYWLNPNSTNGPFRILKYRRVPTVDLYQFGTTAPAPPVYYTRFGSPIGVQGVQPEGGAGAELLVGPIPDQLYNSFMRFKIRHPFNASPNLYTSPIYMPFSWLEIIEYSVAYRLAINQGSQQYMDIFHKALFGDPKNPLNKGLISARTAQMERDANHNERQISVVMTNYSYGGQ
jgi:hypothetical protein